MIFISKMTPKIDVIFHEPRPTNDTNRPKMPHKCHYNKGGIGRGYIQFWILKGH